MKVDDSNIVEQLKQMGMNQRESKLYFALLRVNESTAAELNRVTDIQRTKIYEILEQMKARGFCSERQEGKKKFYRATRPADILEMLEERWKKEKQIKVEDQKNWEMEFDQRNRQTTGIIAGLERLYKSSASNDPAMEKLEVIRTTDQINLKFLHLLNESRGEVLAFTRSPYSASTEASRKAQIKANEEALQRGVKTRSIYMVDSKMKGIFLERIPDLNKAGEQSRFIEELPIKMFVFDRSTVLLSLQFIPGLSGADFTMLAVQDAGLAAACVTLFETYWRRAKTFDKWHKDQAEARQKKKK